MYFDVFKQNFVKIDILDGENKLHKRILRTTENRYKELIELSFKSTGEFSVNEIKNAKISIEDINIKTYISLLKEVDRVLMILDSELLNEKKK